MRDYDLFYHILTPDLFNLELLDYHEGKLIKKQ